MNKAITESPFGAQAAAGEYECVDCGQHISVPDGVALPECPNVDSQEHHDKAWRVLGASEESPSHEATELKGVDAELPRAGAGRIRPKG